jgi:hypothetical protein
MCFRFALSAFVSLFLLSFRLFCFRFACSASDSLVLPFRSFCYRFALSAIVALISLWLQFSFRGDAPWLGLAKMPRVASSTVPSHDVLVGVSETCHMFTATAEKGGGAATGTEKKGRWDYSYTKPKTTDELDE